VVVGVDRAGLRRIGPGVEVRNGHGAWLVSTCPARLLGRDQAITALTIAELQGKELQQLPGYDRDQNPGLISPPQAPAQQQRHGDSDSDGRECLGHAGPDGRVW
jgi:hypothetical protein